jgi:hypothetical protein
MTATLEVPPVARAQRRASAPTFHAPQSPGPFKPTAAKRKPDTKATTAKPKQSGKAARKEVAQGKPQDAPAAPERVTNAGIVRLHNEETIAAVPLYSYAERSMWYGPNGQGGYSKLSDSQAKSLVAEYGSTRP